MDLLKQYLDLQKQIFDYFGYRQDWKVIPLSDETEMYWMLNEHVGGSGTVVWSTTTFTKESITEGKIIYSGVIYTQRHLPKWVYRGPEFTMVSVDTRSDDNKLLMVFRNDRECVDTKLLDLYLECW